MYGEVVRRLPGARVVGVLDPAASDHGWRARAEALAASVAASPEPVALIAHGLAVPVALAASRLHAPAALVLSNGPVTRLDPVHRALASAARRAPGLVAGGLLRPALLTRWLASSAGLRRAVVNPYVMDRDSVVALCAPLDAGEGARRAVAAFLASLAEGLPDPALPACPVGVVWGTEDALYPAYEADFLDKLGARVRRVDVPGARWMHPVERPWAFADAVAALTGE